MRLTMAFSVIAVAALLFGCAPGTPPAGNQPALPEFLGISVGRTVVHSPCRGITGCFECFEYCRGLVGWNMHFNPHRKPEYAGGNWSNQLGVDAEDVVQVMEVRNLVEARTQDPLLVALRAAFGPGEEQGGHHIVWHPSGGLVDYQQHADETRYAYDILYLYSPIARAKLPTLLAGAQQPAAGARGNADSVGVFGINLGARLADCPERYFPKVATPCSGHGYPERDPHLLFVDFPDEGTPEILASGGILTETDAAGMQSISLFTRGLAVQAEILRDLQVLFGPPQQLSGGGAEPVLAQWTLGDRSVRFEGVMANNAAGEGLLRLWTPLGQTYDEERLAARRPAPAPIPFLPYTPPK